MAQLSRPFQIALGAVVVLGLVWAMALRGHTSNPSEPVPRSPSTSTPSTSAAAEAKAAAAPTPIYHGAAPGVEGLTRAIAKAHGAVATSQQNAQQLQSKSGEASGESQTLTSAPAGVSVKGATGAATDRRSEGSAIGRQKSIEAAALSRGAAARAHSRSHSSSRAHSGRSAQQVAVERELAHGKTAMLVFWNPKSTVDQEVRAQAGTLAGGSKGAVTLHVALARQVGVFGTITEVVHVYQTPTILIVNRRGVVSTLTGLTDVFALEQAVREARSAAR
jgi:hypothetical protein